MQKVTGSQDGRTESIRVDEQQPDVNKMHRSFRIASLSVRMTKVREYRLMRKYGRNRKKSQPLRMTKVREHCFGQAVELQIKGLFVSQCLYRIEARGARCWI